jgi:hypothetical protein
LVFIDETWTKTNMEPLRGWAPRGVRLIAKVPHGHWKTTTFLAALRHDRIVAPWLLEGPIDGETFRTYVERVLLPTLGPNDTGFVFKTFIDTSSWCYLSARRYRYKTFGHLRRFERILRMPRESSAAMARHAGRRSAASMWFVPADHMNTPAARRRRSRQ